MSLEQYSLLFLGFYILLLVVVSIIANRESDSGFIIGNREIGYGGTISSLLAGQFNAGGVFIIFTFTALMGYGTILFSLSFILPYMILAFFSRRLYTEAKENQYLMPTDFVRQRLGCLSEKFINLIIILKAILFSISQIMIAGHVFDLLFNMSAVYGIVLTTGIIWLYSISGGYKNVIRTDILQWLFMCILVFVSIIFFDHHNNVETIVSDLNKMASSETYIGMLIFVTLLMISNADPWQRIFSSKSPKVAARSLISSGLIFGIFGASITFVAVALFSMTGGAPEGLAKSQLFFSLFNHSGVIPTVILSLLGAFTLICLMSTVDTQTNLFATSITENILGKQHKQNRKKFIYVSRISMSILLFLVALGSSLIGHSMEFLFKAFSLAYIIGPVFIYALLKDASPSSLRDKLALFSLLLGFSVYIYMFFGGYFSEIINAGIPSGVVIVSICIGTVLIRLGVLRAR